MLFMKLNAEEVKNTFAEWYWRIMVISAVLQDWMSQRFSSASHIVEWAKDKANRLNPENGLCLSATYDAKPLSKTSHFV